MAMQMNSSDGSDGIHDINITPFVDIVLVLLIIFMISTPALVYRGLRISLPKTMTAEEIQRVTLNLVLTKDGTLLLDNKKSTHEDLKRAFERLRASKMPSDALISADAEVSHGKVMELSDFLRSLGIPQIGFATSTKDAKPQLAE